MTISNVLFHSCQLLMMRDQWSIWEVITPQCLLVSDDGLTHSGAFSKKLMSEKLRMQKKLMPRLDQSTAKMTWEKMGQARSEAHLHEDFATQAFEDLLTMSNG
jgi:hypothetical protein